MLECDVWFVSARVIDSFFELVEFKPHCLHLNNNKENAFSTGLCKIYPQQKAIN